MQLHLAALGLGEQVTYSSSIKNSFCIHQSAAAASPAVFRLGNAITARVPKTSNSFSGANQRPAVRAEPPGLHLMDPGSSADDGVGAARSAADSSKVAQAQAHPPRPKVAITSRVAQQEQHQGGLRDTIVANWDNVS